MMNSPQLVARFDAVFAEHPFEHWAKILSDGDVTFGAIATVYDHLSDDQIEANGLFPQIEDSWLRTVDSPFQVTGEVKAQPRMAPEIGEHTRALLEEFGCSSAEVEALLA